jgi:tetratricopeptide (TPR) repeat protein
MSADLRESTMSRCSGFSLRFGILALLLAIAAGFASAAENLVAEGYQHFYNLEYDQAIAAFSAYTSRQPGDPEGFNHVAHAILYRAMFRAGALETEMVTGNNPFLRRPKVDASPQDQSAFDSNVEQAIALARRRLDRNSRDTGALYALGVSYALRANYNFLVRKAWRDALRDATAAKKAHSRVTELDPAFVDARMLQGAYAYLVGSLPLQWRMLGFLAGFHGTKEEGLRTVELVAKEGKSDRLDAEFLLCAMYRREKKPQLAVPLLDDLSRRFPRNYLLRMELAQMYADSGEGGKAIATLETLRARKKAGAFVSLRMEKICFAEGNIQFWYRELDAALENMQRAAAVAEDLDLNTGVLSWMRLGQIYDLKGRRSQAVSAYERAVAFAPDSDAARESRRYLSSPYRGKLKT